MNVGARTQKAIRDAEMEAIVGKTDEPVVFRFWRGVIKKPVKERTIDDSV